MNDATCASGGPEPARLHRARRASGWLPAGPAALAAALLALGALTAHARDDATAGTLDATGGSPAAAAAAPAPAGCAKASYQRTTPSRDGIGKTYLGREIARVMSHAGAAWLERPERAAEEQPERLVAALELRPGMAVADFGAGTGYYAARLARAVAPGGLVYAVEVQPEMLALLERNLLAQGVSNWRPVLAAPDDPNLPAGSVDLVLMVDVYHELEQPCEVLRALAAALRPGGRIAFVEYRTEDGRVPIKSLHKMTEAQIRLEAEAAGLQWQRTDRSLPWQHLVVFTRAARPDGR